MASSSTSTISIKFMVPAVRSAQSPLGGMIRSGTMIHPLCHSAAGLVAVVSKLENLGVPS